MFKSLIEEMVKMSSSSDLYELELFSRSNNIKNGFGFKPGDFTRITYLL